MTFDLTRDLVVTVDYYAYADAGYSISGGFLIGLIPYYHRYVDGYSAGAGLGYSNVDNLSGYVNNTVTVLSANGVTDGQIGVGFDFTGVYGTSATGTNGALSGTNNSIAIRGPAASSYMLVTCTNNLSTYNIPFTLYDASTARTLKRARVRFTDFGQRVIVDCKNATDRVFTNYLNTTLSSNIVDYVRVYVAFTSNDSHTRFSVANVNLNGYDATLTYVYSAADYLGLSPNPAYLTELDQLSAVNYLSTLSTLYSAYSGLGPLVLIQGEGAPYVAGDQYVSIQYTQ